MINSLGLEISGIVDLNCENTNCSNKGKCSLLEGSEEIKQCVCNEGYYLYDCSLNSKEEYSKYLSLKKDIYNKLQEIHDEITQKTMKFQLKQVLIILAQQTDFMQSFTDEEISNQISNQDTEIESLNVKIDEILSTNGKLDFTDLETKKVIQEVQKNVGQTFTFLDGIFGVISEKKKEIPPGNKRLLAANS